MWVLRVAFHCKTIPFGSPPDRWLTKKKKQKSKSTIRLQTAMNKTEPSDISQQIKPPCSKMTPNAFSPCRYWHEGLSKPRNPNEEFIPATKVAAQWCTLGGRRMPAITYFPGKETVGSSPFSAPVTKMDICWNAYSSIDQHFTACCI